MEKKISFIVSIFLILFFILAITKDLIIKSVVSGVITYICGTKVEMRKLSMGVFKHSVRIEDFRMYNPKEFPDGIIVHLPKIAIDYDLFSILKGKSHFSRIDIELKEIGLVKDKDGKLNVDSLKIAQQQEAAKPAKGKKPSKPLALQIDLLNLNMGRIVSKNYSAGEEPIIQVYDINLNKSYKNISSAQQLIALILSEPMKQAGIKGAQIYGIAALTGFATLPVAVVTKFVGKDSAEASFDIDTSKLYSISLDVLERMGEVKSQDKDNNLITAEVNGAKITLKIKKIYAKTSKISISARKYMLPKPEIASGILYEISEQLNKK